jgi:hypothetical protein
MPSYPPITPGPSLQPMIDDTKRTPIGAADAAKTGSGITMIGIATPYGRVPATPGVASNAIYDHVEATHPPVVLSRTSILATPSVIPSLANDGTMGLTPSTLPTTQISSIASPSTPPRPLSTTSGPQYTSVYLSSPLFKHFHPPPPPSSFSSSSVTPTVVPSSATATPSVMNDVETWPSRGRRSNGMGTSFKDPISPARLQARIAASLLRSTSIRRSTTTSDAPATLSIISPSLRSHLSSPSPSPLLSSSSVSVSSHQMRHHQYERSPRPVTIRSSSPHIYSSYSSPLSTSNNDGVNRVTSSLSSHRSPTDIARDAGMRMERAKLDLLYSITKATPSAAVR